MYYPNRLRTRGATSLIVLAAAASVAALAISQSGDANATTRDQPQELIAVAPSTSAGFHPCKACFEFTDPPGAHIGGMQIDAGKLTDQAGHRVGHYTLVSIGVTPFGSHGPGELQQTATLVIGGSQLIAQGLEEPPLSGGTAAITGGTGRFHEASGELSYTDNSDGSTNLTIELNP